MLHETHLETISWTAPTPTLPAPTSLVARPAPWNAPVGQPVGVAPMVVQRTAAPLTDRRNGILMFDSRRRRADDPVDLPPRAGIALLTLQLRAALQAAADAEAEEASWDLDAAVEQLRARLAPLVEDRRNALDEALSQARAEADAAVASALVSVPSVALELSSTVADATKQALVEPDHHDQSAMAVVVIDPDSFSRAFAVAFGAILDGRFAAPGGNAPIGPQWRTEPPTVPTKKSFWAGMWHADVLLSFVAMLVVLVVLIAWSV